MGSNVLRFDFKEMARIAKADPEGFAHKREALIRQLIDKAPRTEHLTELQRTLDRDCYQFTVAGMQLGFQYTDMMLQSAFRMMVHMSTLNQLLQASISNE